MTTKSRDEEVAQRVLRHWHEAVPNDRIAHLVKDATRGFLRSLQVRLVRHDVQLGHWTFLRILWERDGLTKRELSIEAGVMEPTTFVALKAMEELGYVRLEQRPDNRKNVYVYLTPLGKRLKRVLVPLAEEVNGVALEGIAAGDVETARRALLKMVDNLGRDTLAESAATAPKAGKQSARRGRVGGRPSSGHHG
jgi:DNA-binding MarR family transcriptional regulator